MGYIILRDTFGRGLEEISKIGLEVIDEPQLDDYIHAAHEHILAEEGWDGVDDYENDENNNPMGETLVICEIVDEIKGKFVDDYIYDVSWNPSNPSIFVTTNNDGVMDLFDLTRDM